MLKKSFISRGLQSNKYAKRITAILNVYKVEIAKPDPIIYG